MIINSDTFLELSIFAIFAYAVATEFTAITENTKSCTNAQSIAETSGVSLCDLIGSAAQLNANSERQRNIGWRRAVIASATLTTVSSYALNIPLSFQQKLGMLILTFLTFFSVEGFSNYYYSNATSLAVDFNLQKAINELNSTACSPGLHYQSLKNWLRPMHP